MILHGVQRITYENWSCEVFEGFYDTIIGDFSSVYEMEPTPPEGYEYDIRDWKGYQKKVGEQFTELLDRHLPENTLVYNLNFRGIISPREYNFTTDKVEIDMDVDIDGLEEYCFRTNRFKFDDYLRENFSNRDGFWSFIHNNVHDFEIELENGFADESERDLQVMIEFYLLQEIAFECLREDLYEDITEIQWEHLCLYNREDGCQYDYSVNCDNPNEEDVVIVKEKIND